MTFITLTREDGSMILLNLANIDLISIPDPQQGRTSVTFLNDKEGWVWVKETPKEVEVIIRHALPIK